MLSDFKVESSRKIRELQGELAISKSAEEDSKKQVSMAKVLFPFHIYKYMYSWTFFQLYIRTISMYCMDMIGPTEDSEREGRHPNAAH